MVDDEIQLAPASSGDGAIVPEGRYILHLIRIEKAPPSDFAPEEGPRIKWVFNLYAEAVDGMEKGQAFWFDGSQYEMYRHTSTKNSPRAFARQYTEALLGRALQDGEIPPLRSLLDHKMSGLISYEVSVMDSSKQSMKLTSLKHVFPDKPAAKAQPAPAATKRAAGQVTADASADDVDRALLESKLQKQVNRAVQLETPSSAQYRIAMTPDAIADATFDTLKVASEVLTAEIAAAIADD